MSVLLEESYIEQIFSFLIYIPVISIVILAIGQHEGLDFSIGYILKNWSNTCWLR